MDKRLVIFGGSGFIGKEFINSVANTDLKYIAPDKSEIDLTFSSSQNKLKQILKPTDIVIMFAALTPDRGKDIKTFKKNINMVENLCNVLKLVQPKKLIYFSSDAVYGSTAVTINDKSKPSPDDLYGLMHLTREVMFREAINDESLLVLRPSIIYGKNDTHNSYGPNRFIRSAESENKILLFGKGEERRDHVFVDDLVSIIKDSIRHNITGTYNVATGKSYSFYEIAKLITQKRNRKTDIIFSKRANPISHRYYNNSIFLQTYKNFNFTNVKKAFEKII